MEEKVFEYKSLEIQFCIENDSISFTFPSKVTFTVSSILLSENSQYFKNYIDFGNHNKSDVQKTMKIDLVSLGWHEFGEYVVIAFLIWLGSDAAVLNSLNAISIFYFAIISDYFQVSKQKEDEICQQLESFNIEENYETIQKYWSHRYLRIQFLKAMLYGKVNIDAEPDYSYNYNPRGNLYGQSQFFPKNHVVTTKILSKNPFQDQPVKSPILFAKETLLILALNWINEDRISNLQELYQIQGFYQLQEFIKENPSLFNLINRTALANILRLYKFAYLAVDLITSLDSLQTL